MSAEAIHTAGQRLLTAGNTGMVPIGRKTTLGLDLVSRRGAEATELDVSPVLVALKAEVDDPPDRFRDPIMLTLMDEPVVISSGHPFDRATLYDARDRFRFKQCPMTRCDMSRARTRSYLERELVEWARAPRQGARGGGGVPGGARRLALAFAKQLIDSSAAAPTSTAPRSTGSCAAPSSMTSRKRWSKRSKTRGSARSRRREQRRDLRERRQC